MFLHSVNVVVDDLSEHEQRAVLAVVVLLNEELSENVYTERL